MRSSASHRTAELIRQHFLFSGASQIGDRLPRVQELARRYGVSVPTVSKALSQLQAEGLIEATRGAGIFIKAIPAALSASKPQRSRSLGFISNSLHAPVAQEVTRGISQTAAMQGCRVEFAITDWDINEERWHFQNMAKQGLDGVIIYPGVSAPREPHYLASILPDFPTVVIDLARPEMKRPSIVFDNWKAGFDMTKYLLDAGHRQIGFIGLSNSRSVEDRFKGYCRALSGSKVELEADYVFNGSPCLLAKSCVELVKRIAAMESRPTAIIAPTDQFALRLIGAMEQMGDGLEEIVVTGFDNVQGEEWRYRFPTTGPDFYNLGVRAVDMLLSIIDSCDAVPSETLLPVPLVFPPAIEGSIETRRADEKS